LDKETAHIDAHQHFLAVGLGIALVAEGVDEPNAAIGRMGVTPRTAAQYMVIIRTLPTNSLAYHADIAHVGVITVFCDGAFPWLIKPLCVSAKIRPNMWRICFSNVSPRLKASPSPSRAAGPIENGFWIPTLNAFKPCAPPEADFLTLDSDRL
jgi:hypothetical protein